MTNSSHQDGEDMSGRRGRRLTWPLVGLLLAVLALGISIVVVSVGEDAGTKLANSADGASEAVDAEVIEPEDRVAVPPISGTSLQGDPIALSDFPGRIVVLNVWGSWCAPCRAEAPVLREVSNLNQSRGVQFLGINVRDQQAAAIAFEEQFRVRYPSIFDPAGETLLQFRDSVPPNAIPSTIIIDGDARVAATVIGPTTYSQLSALVDEVVSER